MASLISASLTLPCSLPVINLFLGYGIGGFRCLFPYPVVPVQFPGKGNPVCQYVQVGLLFLLPEPLCRMMMYWWFAYRCAALKSLPSSAQSASVKVALSSSAAHLET
ncbi:hypothetical protein ACRFA2_22550 (plasmid) [Bacteroides hominis]|uniref:hypothetical protein n=1 Tax=Bacteroides hominis TaxID=2763023 RepID=UPI003D6C8159